MNPSSLVNGLLLSSVKLNLPPAVAVVNSHRCIFTQSSEDRRIFRERRLVGWSPQALYGIVSTVSEYKHFLPACYDSQIVERISDKRLKAELFIGIPPLINESYISDVTLVPTSSVRAISLDSRLFHHLQSEWTFKPGVPGIPNSCWIYFDLDFEFKSRLYKKLISGVFDQMAKATLIAFLKRAHEVYGRETSLNVNRTLPQN